MKVLGSSAKTAFYYKKIKGFYPDWHIIYKLKCSSSEDELTRILKKTTIIKSRPVVIVAKEQFSGIGQKSRRWFSPRGGIWLSAAYPIFSDKFSNNIFTLSVAVKLCEMLRRESIEAYLKWPNDIIFDSKKLIGFLPKVISRGKETMYVRIGLGMNLLNKTPSEGVSLSQVLQTKRISEHFWTARILKSINEAICCNDKKRYIIKEANRHLLKKYLPSDYNKSDWMIKDIDNNANLRIYNKTKEKKITMF